MKKRLETLLIAFLLLFLPALLYINSLPATTLWEDDGLILDNRVIREPGNILRLFSPSYWATYHLASFKDYRPVGLSSFIIDNTLLEPTVKTYRAVNILIYSLTCLLVYFLASLLFSSERRGLAAALLFAAHPAHVEAVVWLKNRPELLAALLMLTSLLFFAGYCLAGRRRTALLAASLLAGLLAFLSKESALILPLVICLTLILLRRERRTETRAAVLIPYFTAAGAVYLFKMFSVSRGRAGDALSYLPHPVSRVALAVKTAGSYLRLLILPTDLSIQHVAPAIGQAMDYEFLLALTASFAFVLALLAALRRNRLLAFALAWTALCLLPASNTLVMLSGRPVAEQRLFFPSAGFCMAVACFMRAGRGWRSRWIPLAAIVVCFGVLTMNRNRDWADRRTLMERALATSPGSWKPGLSLSLLSFEDGDYDGAFRHARTAATGYPNLTEPYRSMGALYGRLGHLEKAEGYYRLALRIDPHDYLAHNGLGNIYSKAGKYGRARQEYLRSVGNWPQPAPILANIGWTYEKEGRSEEAVRCYREAILSYPDYKKAYCDLGRVLYKMEKQHESRRAFEEAIEIDEGYGPAHRGIGEIELARGRHEEAREHFRRALAVSPGTAEVLNSMAVSYKRDGDLRTAFEYYRRALASNPRVQTYMDSLLDTYRSIGDPALLDRLSGTIVESSRKCLASGHPAMAKAYLETLLQADPGNAKAKEMIMRLYSRGRDGY